MTVFRQRRASWKTVAIGIFVVLIANQWISLVRFHSREYYFSQLEFDPPPNHHRRTHNVTTRGHGQEQHPQNPEIEVVNEIIHRAFFGLGHRFHRSAAAYHLAQSLALPPTQTSSTISTDPATLDQFQHQPVITHFRFHWESCLSSDEIRNASIVDDEGEGGKEYNVFRYLFGDDLWKLNTLRTSQNHTLSTKDSDKNASSDAKPQIRRNMVIIRNDVSGYIAGQLYKDLQLPISYSSKSKASQINDRKRPLLAPMASFDQYEAILDKVMRSDIDFYHRLVDNYRFKKELRKFQIQHKWDERPLVIGLHLRAGNGEDAHFTESGRASSNDIDESTMIARLVRLTNMAVIRETKRLGDRKVYSGQRRKDYKENSVLRPLLFVATDTAHLLPLITKMIDLGTIQDESNHNNHTQPTIRRLEIVTWPQDRLPENAGVTFDVLQGKGERCLQGWRSAMSDSLMLSTVDVLIAAKRSTFTQSLPLTLGFDQNREKSNGDGVNIAFFSNDRNDNDSNKAMKQSNEMVIRRKRSFSFCEVSELDFIDMTCFADVQSWLFRGKDDRHFPISKDKGVSNPERNERIWSFSIANGTSGTFDPNQTYRQVKHKVTVLLPDVDPPSEFNSAREFLRRENMITSKPMASGTEIYESIFPYGRSKINKKYRNSHQLNSNTSSSWNFILNANS